MTHVCACADSSSDAGSDAGGGEVTGSLDDGYFVSIQLLMIFSERKEVR